MLSNNVILEFISNSTDERPKGDAAEMLLLLRVAKIMGEFTCSGFAFPLQAVRLSSQRQTYRVIAFNAYYTDDEDNKGIRTRVA